MGGCSVPVGIAEGVGGSLGRWMFMEVLERGEGTSLQGGLFRAFPSRWELGWTRPWADCSRSEVSPAWSRMLDWRPPCAPSHGFLLILNSQKKKRPEQVSSYVLKTETNVGTNLTVVWLLGLHH